MWLLIVAVVAVIATQSSGYWYDPGPGEYIASLLFAVAIISGVLGLFGRLR
jgi:hypothetical protein